MTLASWILVFYIAFVLVAAYIRFWTESEFWHAIHTGRTFMLQAAALAVGSGFTYLDQAGKLNAVLPFIPRSNIEKVKDILTPHLSKMLPVPEIIFGLGTAFIVLYILLGFPEGDFLKPTGNPAHPKKYVSQVNQEPTRKYKCFIALCLWLGVVCLLVAWFFLLGVEIRWYLGWFVVPAHLLLVALLIIGYSVDRVRGTAGKPQQWDLQGIPGKLD